MRTKQVKQKKEEAPGVEGKLLLIQSPQLLLGANCKFN